MLTEPYRIPMVSDRKHKIMSTIDTSPRNDVDTTIAAVQSYPGFSATFNKILEQRSNNQAYIPYYVYKEESQNVNLGGIPIKVKFDNPGDVYYSTIADAFADVSLITGVAFKEVSSKAGSLLDIGRLEDGHSQSQYYGSGGVLGMSLALGNELGSLWRLQTWGESQYGDSSTDLLDTQATIRHEIGHALGLSHPDPDGGGADGNNPLFNQLDSVMSYNMTTPPNSFYTEADQIALRSIFSSIQGLENIEPLINIKKDNTRIFEYSDDNQALTSYRKKKWNPVDPITGERLQASSSASEISDLLVTSRGNDSVDAGDGDDWVSTGRGDDIVEGGDGVNRIRTGPGRDTVIIRYREGREGFDAVHDFSKVDRLQLIGFDTDGLMLTSFGKRSVLTHYEDLIGVFDHTLTFGVNVDVIA